MQIFDYSIDSQQLTKILGEIGVHSITQIDAGFVFLFKGQEISITFDIPNSKVLLKNGKWGHITFPMKCMPYTNTDIPKTGYFEGVVIAATLDILNLVLHSYPSQLRKLFNVPGSMSTAPVMTTPTYGTAEIITEIKNNPKILTSRDCLNTMPHYIVTGLIAILISRYEALDSACILIEERINPRQTPRKVNSVECMNKALAYLDTSSPTMIIAFLEILLESEFKARLILDRLKQPTPSTPK